MLKANKTRDNEQLLQEIFFSDFKLLFGEQEKAQKQDNSQYHELFIYLNHNHISPHRTMGAKCLHPLQVLR